MKIYPIFKGHIYMNSSSNTELERKFKTSDNDNIKIWDTLNQSNIRPSFSYQKLKKEQINTFDKLIETAINEKIPKSEQRAIYYSGDNSFRYSDYPIETAKNYFNIFFY